MEQCNLFYNGLQDMPWPSFKLKLQRCLSGSNNHFNSKIGNKFSFFEFNNLAAPTERLKFYHCYFYHADFNLCKVSGSCNLKYFQKTIKNWFDNQDFTGLIKNSFYRKRGFFYLPILIVML